MAHGPNLGAPEGTPALPASISSGRVDPREQPASQAASLEATIPSGPNQRRTSWASDVFNALNSVESRYGVRQNGAQADFKKLCDREEQETTSWGPGGTPPPGSSKDVPKKAKKTPCWPATIPTMAAKLGLDKPTLIAMFKGSLSPIICLAILQASPVAEHFATIGYLMAIASILAHSLFPRGKFLTNLVLHLLAICFAAGTCLFGIWMGLQARHSTQRPDPLLADPQLRSYNSSQSVVCAVWLFANIWFVNLIRAERPVFNGPVIFFSIFANAALTQGPLITSTAAARTLISRLLTTMLAGLAVGTAVNLLVFPISSRQIVFRHFAGSIRQLRGLLALQKAYLASLDPNAAPVTRKRTHSIATMGPDDQRENGGLPGKDKEAAAAEALGQAGAKLRALMSQLRIDLPFAKRDIAWGKLDAKDLSSLMKLFRNIHITMLGMNTMMDILQRFSERPEWEDEEEGPLEEKEKEMEKRAWKAVMVQVHEPFKLLSEAVDQGLEHAGICLEFLPRPKRETSVRAVVRRFSARLLDLEANRGLMPGDRSFARIVADKMGAFQARKGEMLKKWLQKRGIDLDSDAAELAHFQSEQDQVHLYIILYLETLMHEAGEAVQDLVDFADQKVRDGTMSRKRLITPTLRRLRKWLLSIFRDDDESVERSPGTLDTEDNPVYCFGAGFAPKRDLEHLPPATAWQRFGEQLRKIPAVISSDASMFGLRVACATLTVGIVAFMEHTEMFFREHRLVWAMIVVTLGMTITSGQSFFSFMCRIAGTVIAMVLSLIAWYMVVGRPPGVILLLWCSLFLCYYFFVKYPRFFPAILTCLITQVLIIGYELEALVIGVDVVQQTGQSFYPTYLLAQYRLACVAGGSFVAFFWTIFPYPLTDRTRLRRELSATLYHLASHFAIISSAIKFNIHGDAGDIGTPGTPAHMLSKANARISNKTIMLLASSGAHADWEKFEPTIGGKFPREAYMDIIRRCRRIMAYMALTSYILMRPSHPSTLGSDPDRGPRPRSSSSRATSGVRGGGYARSLRCRLDRRPSIWTHSRAWCTALAGVLDALEPAHHTIMSTLTLLSHALLSGQRLPPFLPLPRPYDVTRQLMHLRRAAEEETDDDDDDESTSNDDSSGGAPIRMVNSRTGQDDLPGGATAAVAAEAVSAALGSGFAGGAGAGPRHLHHHQHHHRHRRYPSHHSLHSAYPELDVTTILDPRNVDQPGYAEFAVLQVCTTLVCYDLEGLLRAVSGLVGVVDFGFSVGGDKESVEMLGDKDGGKRKRQ
ncbi:hypothetical protein VTJ83DRAFT_1338 [Remersonia thermophila]|uniref:ER transporter 6TM N-terminal domain-containing protein n=1 Tax=Remersonia thermophila TaxID=72144 RepID=A0ABR4DQT6_9PEZI